MSEKARLGVAVEAISDCLRSDGADGVIVAVFRSDKENASASVFLDGALRPQDGLDLAKRIREAFEDAHKNGKAHPVACDTVQVQQ